MSETPPSYRPTPPPSSHAEASSGPVAEPGERITVEVALTRALVRNRALETILSALRPAIATIAIQGDHPARATAAAALASMDALGL